MPIKAAAARAAGELVHRARELRPPRRRKGRILLVVALLLLASAGTGGFVWWKSTTLPDGAAFAVGDRVVMESELQRRMETMRALYGVEAPAGAPERMDDYRRAAAKSYAVAMVLTDKADEMDVSTSDTAARATLDGYISRQFGPGRRGRGGFVTALGNVGASEDDVLAEIKQQLAVSKLFEHITRDVTVSEPELRESFSEFQDRLGVPEQRWLRNIVVDSRERAAELVSRLEDGADFATLAGQYSLDGSTRDTGGVLGLVAKSELEPRYGKAAFGATDGAVYGPVQTQRGWNVGLVDAIKPGAPARYDEVKEQLRTLVKYDEQLSRWQQWLADALQAAEVRYADAYRPDDPLSVPTNVRPSGPPSPRGGRG